MRIAWRAFQILMADRECGPEAEMREAQEGRRAVGRK